jgi:hypothetical protein
VRATNARADSQRFAESQGRNREYGQASSMTIEEAIDEVKMPGPDCLRTQQVELQHRRQRQPPLHPSHVAIRPLYSCEFAAPNLVLARITPKNQGENSQHSAVPHAFEDNPQFPVRSQRRDEPIRLDGVEQAHPSCVPQRITVVVTKAGLVPASGSRV